MMGDKPNAREVRAAFSDFEKNLSKADQRREELGEDERSKDTLLSLFYDKADRSMCNLRRMGLLTW